MPQASDLSPQFPTNPYYASPECFKNDPTLKSGVFSFGIILCEMLSCQPGFPRNLPGPQLMKMIVLDQARPVIPDSVDRKARGLIRDCGKQNAPKRPSFEEILERLDAMDFKIAAGVNSVRVR
jgi:hypothetical protein